MCVAGGIPVLIAAISPASQAAVSESCNLAVDAIHSLTSRAALPSELVDEAEDLLLHLQAVPRLITFLRSLAHVHFPPLDAGSNVLLHLCTCSASPLTELLAFPRVFVQFRPQVTALHSVMQLMYKLHQFVIHFYTLLRTCTPVVSTCPTVP